MTSLKNVRLDRSLVHRAVPDAELDAEVESVVAALLEGSPAARARAKNLVRAVVSTPMEEIDGITSGMIAEVRPSPEGCEGVRAFLEKGKPAWRVAEEA